MDIKVIQDKIVQVSDNYATEFSINRDDTWYILKLQEEMGELIKSYLSLTKHGRSRGKNDLEIKQDFTDELADVMGHLILVANNFDIDIEKAIQDKRFKYLQ